MEKIKELLNHISNIVVAKKTQQEERRKRGENFNIFKVLGLTSSEVRLHSAFLAELLNPNGDHGLEDKFLKAFLEIVIGKKANFDFDTKSAKTYVEYDIGTISEDYKEGGRIDILIRDRKGATIIIENKIYAGDQPWQMYRYNRYAEKHCSTGNYILLYLTLDNNKPSEESTGKDPEFNYFCISYKEDILTWLKQCVGTAALHPSIRETISQYQTNLTEELNIMDDSSNKDFINFLVNESNIEATLSIWEIASDIGITIRKNFIEKRLRKVAEMYNMELSYDAKFPLLPSGEKKTYNGIRFKIPEYSNIFFKIEQWNNEVHYGIVVDNIEDKLKTIKGQYEDWNNGISIHWPYGSKTFPDKLKYWDIKESLLDMVKGNKLIDIIIFELKRVIDNHLIEKLDRNIKRSTIMEIKSINQYNIDGLLLTAKQVSCAELSSFPELEKLWDRIVSRLGEDSYFSNSIEFFVTPSNALIIKSRLSDFVIDTTIIEGDCVICNSGGLKNDGHLNEFINECIAMPSMIYYVDGAFMFKTDSLGRTIGTIEYLHSAKNIGRGGHSSFDKITSAKDGKTTDVGGHIIANNVNGPSEAINIVPMDSSFNNSGDWKSMEKMIQNAFYYKNEIRVKKELFYPGDSKRPNKITVNILIDGEESNYLFDLP